MRGIFRDTPESDTRNEPHPISRRRLFHRTAAAIIAPSVAAVLASPAAALARSITRTSGRSARPTAVLVHGSFTDASSWTGVITLLQQAGYEAVAVELPLTSLAEDVAVTRAALATVSGPVVLVGHSYGGAVISGAATGMAQVKGLVYAAAFAPEQGETLSTITSRYPTTEGVKHTVPAYPKGFVWIDPVYFPQVFVQDIPLARAQALAYEQRPITVTSFTEKVGPAAWHSLPCWYLVSQHDRCIDPRVEWWYARRIQAQTRLIPSSHASPVSHPHAVTATILEAIWASERVK